MSGIEQTKAIVQTCIVNSEELLKAAKASLAAGASGSAYHLAALSLEEIGKATLVLVATSAKEERIQRYFDTAEDHEKKLFWALWAPTLNSGDVSGKQIQEFQELARNIHNRRLGAIYVDAKTGIRLSVAPERVNELIRIVESRIGLEKLREFGEPDEKTKADFAWFENAAEDKNTANSLIFTRGSFDKLKELNGDIKAWIRWLREQVEESEKEARELLQRELARQRPSEEEQLEPKWKVRIKLYSDSHSIRLAPLSEWNRGVESIKLQRLDAKSMFVEFTIPKGIHANALYQAGYSNAARFLLALNMGTFGLYYWYLPTFISHYYDSVTDLENSRRLDMEQTPVKINWGKANPLGSQDLQNSTLVYAYMAHFDEEQLQATEHYLRGLAFLCKSDIFLQLSPGALQAFLSTLRGLMKASKEWDGVEPFNAAAERALEPLVQSLSDAMRVLELAAAVEQRKEGLEVTMQDAFMMKFLCDAYVVKRARESFVQARKPPI